jgi:hypothetical protein
MGYLPPAGFVEPRRDDLDGPGAATRFHARADCPRVLHPDLLRPVDRPYSAARCPGCADPFGNNLELFPDDGDSRRATS